MLSQTKSNHSNLSNFREVVRNISEVIGRFGVRVVPFRSPDLTHFRLLTEARQRLAIQQAMSYSESLDMVVREGWSLNDEKRALWSALRFFGFRPNSDVFSFIKDGDSVELYNSEHIQLWRNLGFMKICSYSLEEMFCFPWGERYIRDEVSLNTALETIGKLLQGRTRETIHLNLRNILVETFSEEKFVIDVVHEYLAPVMDGPDHVAGYIVISRPLSAVSSREDRRDGPTRTQLVALPRQT